MKVSASVSAASRPSAVKMPNVRIGAMSITTNDASPNTVVRPEPRIAGPTSSSASRSASTRGFIAEIA